MYICHYKLVLSHMKAQKKPPPPEEEPEEEEEEEEVPEEG